MIRALIARVTRRPPDFVIGGAENPYLRRWWIARNRFFSIYLHEMLRDDDDRALHDHPWANASIVLAGGYIEVVPTYPCSWPALRDLRRVWRGPGAIVFRGARAAHRIELQTGYDGRRLPSWSLFLCGPRVREWGFYCPQGWRHYKRFVANRSGESRVGRGCD